MKKYFLLIVFFCSISFAQKISNDFSGYFENKLDDEFFKSLHFNGKGHLIINDTLQAFYFKYDDKVVMSIMTFSYQATLNNNELTGFDILGKTTHFSLSEPKNKKITFEDYEVNPNLLFEYYSLEYDIDTQMPKYAMFEDEEYYDKVKVLCEKELVLACDIVYEFEILKSMNYIEDKIEENEKILELERIYNKISPAKGYLMMGAYYILLKNKTKAQHYLNLAEAKGASTISYQVKKMKELLKEIK